MHNSAPTLPTASAPKAGARNQPKPPSDMALHNDFIRYGGYARHYTRKCLGLLPEIHRRHIYQKRRFVTIFEYARKLAGLSDAQIKRVLSLQQAFAACPHLQKMLTLGKEGISKLARVASIATPENDQELAQKVKTLPQSALEVLVRDEQAAQQKNRQKFPFGQTFVVQGTGEIISDPTQAQSFMGKNQNEQTGFYSLPQPFNEGENFVRTHKSELHQNFSGGQIGSQGTPAQGSTFPAGSAPTSPHLPSAKIEELYLTEEVKNRLLNLQKKGININELLLELLEARGRELEEEKGKLVENLKEKETRHSSGSAPSRYIPAAVRHHLTKEHGQKCSIEDCTRRAQNIHHTRRFALDRSHDPRYLAPLCAEHHKIAHSVDRKYHKNKTSHT